MQRKLIDDYIALLKLSLDKFDRDELLAAAKVLREAADRKSSIWICGNGGSAALATHLAYDLAKGASYPYSRRYAAFALSDNNATLLSYANDVSYDDIFIEQLKTCLRGGDVVIGLSTSGNTKNIIKAVEYANANGGITLGLAGSSNSALSKAAKYNVTLNIDNASIVSDLHLVLSHILVDLLTDGQEKAGA